MKKFITNKYVLTILGIVLFFAIWLIISYSVQDQKMIFPDPWSTVKEAGRILQGEYIYKCIGWTFMRMAIGFTCAFTLACIFGVIAGNFPHFKTLFKPIVVALKSIPTSAFVFLFLIVSGARYAPIYIVVFISFPILYEAFSAGVSNVPQEILEAAKIDGGGVLRTIFKIRLPLALPYIFVGIASSFALSFKIEIMAEITSGDTKHGIGSAISAAQKSDPSNMLPIFAYSLIAVVFILLVTILEDVVARKIRKY